MQIYKQYCPVARASEIFADRWTPLIVRELIAGSHRLNEIERGLPGISRSLLASRLRHLEDAGVVERLPAVRSNVSEYHLSEAGRELKVVIEALGGWGVRWAFGEPRPEELGAGLRWFNSRTATARRANWCLASAVPEAINRPGTNAGAKLRSRTCKPPSTRHCRISAMRDE